MNTAMTVEKLYINAINRLHENKNSFSDMIKIG